MEILMGVTAPGGKLCLLMRQPEGTEDRSTILTRIPGADPEWLLQDFNVEFASVCATPQAAGNSPFLGLTGEGRVFFIRDGRIVRIPGAGFTLPGSRKLGRMDNLLVLNNQLVAMGYGGQAYVSDTGEAWAPIASTFPKAPIEPDTIRFGTAAYQSKSDRYVFGGEVVIGISISAGLAEASRLGDPTQIAAMIRAQARRDYGALWLLERDAWRDVPLPTNDILDEVVTADGKTVYLRFRVGVVYATQDFVELTEVAANSEGLSALGEYRGEALLADEASIFTLTPTTTEPFEPPLPPMRDRMLVLSSSDDDLYVIREWSIWRLHAGEWSEVVVPADVVTLGSN